MFDLSRASSLGDPVANAPGTGRVWQADSEIVREMKKDGEVAVLFPRIARVVKHFGGFAVAVVFRFSRLGILD